MMRQPNLPVKWLNAAVLLWVLLAVIAPHHTAAAPLTPDWGAPHVPGELLIKLPPGDAAAVQARLEQEGLSVTAQMPQINLVLAEVSGPTGAPAADGRALADAAGIAEDAGALWVEPNYLLDPLLIPNDVYYAGIQSPYLSRLEMPAAWDKTTGRPEIVIAVLDTGVNFNHPDLRDGIWANPGEIAGNGVDDEGNGFIDDAIGWDFAQDDNLPDDDHGHGTHVAGIAAARINNGQGIAGMAGNATIMPVDVFRDGIGSYADLIQAILYAADNGAHVINMSLGASSYSRGEEEAVNYAWRRNVVVVAAAGNTRANTYRYPAAHSNAIAVSAVDSTDAFASFSTWGDFVDVAAPGVSIMSSYRNSYSYLSGTSMAAPHVAGLAALILSADPTLSPAQVRALIEDNTDDLGAPGWDPFFGRGRINARKALDPVALNPVPIPPRPPVQSRIWPPGCRELVANRGFDTGLDSWSVEHSVDVRSITGPAGTTTQAARFTGGPNSHGRLSQAITIPAGINAATLDFFFRIETADTGKGLTPQAPWDDGWTVELQRQDGTVLRSLLRTGNTGDGSGSGLPWDEYLYAFSPEDVTLLRANQPVVLVFEARNDGDTLPTTFWLDDVRLCAASGPSLYLPLIAR
jgi:subtilisin family serine protease